MDWKKVFKIVVNAGLSFGASYIAAQQMGLPPRAAATMAGVSLLANYLGLSQEQAGVLGALMKKDK